jgi:hypothetical protein
MTSNELRRDRVVTGCLLVAALLVAAVIVVMGAT